MVFFIGWFELNDTIFLCLKTIILYYFILIHYRNAGNIAKTTEASKKTHHNVDNATKNIAKRKRILQKL